MTDKEKLDYLFENVFREIVDVSGVCPPHRKNSCIRFISCERCWLEFFGKNEKDLK